MSDISSSSPEETAAYEMLAEAIRSTVPDQFAASDLIVLALKLRMAAWRSGYEGSSRVWEKAFARSTNPKREEVIAQKGTE